MGERSFLNNTYSVQFWDEDFDYLIPRLDGSIIVGSARRAYIRDKDEWYGNVDDTRMIDQARSYFEGYMQKHFAGWEDSGAYVDDMWTGIMGYSSNRLPRVGPIPRRPGMLIMGGFTGHGMSQIFLSALGIAQMAAGGRAYERAGLPRLFKETQAQLNPRDRVRNMRDLEKPSKL